MTADERIMSLEEQLKQALEEVHVLRLGHVQVNEEPPRSLDTYQEHRDQR